MAPERLRMTLFWRLHYELWKCICLLLYSWFRSDTALLRYSYKKVFWNYANVTLLKSHTQNVISFSLFVDVFTHTHTHTHTHTDRHAHTRTHAHTHINTYTHTNIYIYIYIYIFVYIYRFIYVYIIYMQQSHR